jgi:UDP-glucose 4-epimerase
LRVLVTGGAGFIGSHIVDQLIRQGDEVLVIDDLSTGVESNVNRKAKLVKLDIGDPSLVDLASSFRPDAISHLAAQASVPVSVSQPSRDALTNIFGGLNVCRATVESGCSQFIYVTTGGALYGVPEYLPCDEDHPIRPISPYGLSKWTLEQYLHMLLPGEVALKVLRLANVYGPRQNAEGEANVVAIFGQRMIRWETVRIDGDGEQTRDFVYVGDVTEAHRLALESVESITVNIGTGEGLSINRLFQLMAEETSYRQPPVHAEERRGDIKHVVLDGSKAGRELGWRPRTSLVDGLRKTLASLAK